MEGDIKLVITMLSDLADLLHSATFLQLDFTFKRVLGEMDELEVVIWEAGRRERVFVDTFI